ncbi:mitochondrial intermembrane space import and assembly protein 40 isoform X1 [Vulpes lagopus]|uniref:mitochondrial intermembrane space import and assembly protein 40 isoform X1 n=1 Tax=Vulpes lagopus TaxID=494514 RepID=UPI001BC97AAD|nr:mitochondrial intermembrane space import and assembly protein 40 isoform X1 [Vulpes lagopus]
MRGCPPPPPPRPCRPRRPATPLRARAAPGAARGPLFGTLGRAWRWGRHLRLANERTETGRNEAGPRSLRASNPDLSRIGTWEHWKDRIIFVTKEDHETPSNAELVADDPNDPYEEHGLILPNGDINWNCPCLGGMASGPCGEQFKSAFSCFHYSTEDVKGSDCVDQFRAMQECMQKYPDLYPQEDEEEEEEKKPAERLEETAATEATTTKEEEGSS